MERGETVAQGTPSPCIFIFKALSVTKRQKKGLETAVPRGRL